MKLVNTMFEELSFVAEILTKNEFSSRSMSEENIKWLSTQPAADSKFYLVFAQNIDPTFESDSSYSIEFRLQDDNSVKPMIS